MIDVYNVGHSAMALFIFILIISGNYLGNLFPCRIQDAFEHNIWLKHFLGYFTLLFFVLLTMPQANKLNIKELIISTSITYLFFIILSKTPPMVWLSVFIIYSIVYLLQIKKNDLEDSMNNKKKKTKVKNDDKSLLKTLTIIQEYIVYFSALLIGVGFLTYMGEKKLEYKNNFTYVKFLFGSVKCKGFTKDRRYLNSLYHAFD